MELWIFAVNYHFNELAKYCLSSGGVRREIGLVLKNVNKGLRWFLEEQNIPLAAMQKVIAWVASSSTWERESSSFSWSS
jgi:hypothetical protein